MDAATALGFAGFVLDLRRGSLLTRTREEIPLRRQSFELLRLLVENAGRLLDRDTINRAIWSDVAVTDDSITQCIRDIRRAIGDDAQRILRTVPRRGYLFAAQVTTARDPLPGLALPDQASIAVLPFQNMSGDPEQEYFADGMVEEITTGLSRIRSLFVISRNSAFTYKGRAVDVRQVGRELGVRYVLEGSVRKAASRVRITGQLVDTASGAHLWADRFDGTFEDVFDLQDRVTASVVAAIEPNIRRAEIQRAQRKPAGSLLAYDLLLRSWPHFYTRTRESLAEAEQLLRKAIEIDPDYAPALAALATFQWITVSQGWMNPADPAVTEMIRLAQAALALAGNDPEILLLTSRIIALPGGNLTGGIAMINKSIELNPNDSAGMEAAAMLHAYAGDRQSALAHLERSVRLNPVNRTLPFYFSHALIHFVAGEHDKVIEWTGMALQPAPIHAGALRYRAASFGLLGRLEEGRHVVRQLLELIPDFTIGRARRHIEVEMNNIFKTHGVAESLYEGLRLSGVPE